jgi:hypothetical protein
MIHEACLLLDRNEFRPKVVPEDGVGTLNTIPNFSQRAALQGTFLLRRVRALIRRERF